MLDKYSPTHFYYIHCLLHHPFALDIWYYLLRFQKAFGGAGRELSQ